MKQAEAGRGYQVFACIWAVLTLHRTNMVREGTKYPAFFRCLFSEFFFLSTNSDSSLTLFFFSFCLPRHFPPLFLACDFEEATR